ncbi:MAG: hypothetical protein L6Q81_16875 [Bacteroidia bacterium]|nr:hypothetical protein [Bacteroidia bacterium]
MNKSLRFTLMTVWILLSRSYDAWCTNQFTPDLSKEANPLVSFFGLSWTPLLLIITALTLYVIVAYYFSVFRKKSLVPAETGMSFNHFFAFLYLGRKDHWSAIFYKFPKQQWRFHHYMGMMIAPALAYAGVISTLMWIGIKYIPAYRPIHSLELIYSLIIGGTFLISILISRKMYSEYKRQVITT